MLSNARKRPLVRRAAAAAAANPEPPRDPNAPRRPLVRRVHPNSAEVPPLYQGILTIDQYLALQARTAAGVHASGNETRGTQPHTMADIDFDKEEEAERLLDPEADLEAEDGETEQTNDEQYLPTGKEDEVGGALSRETLQSRPATDMDASEDEILDFDTGSHFSGSGPSKTFHPPEHTKVTSAQRFEQHARIHNESRVAKATGIRATSSPCPRVASLTTSVRSHQILSAAAMASDIESSLPSVATHAKEPNNPRTPIRNKATTKNRRQKKAPVVDESEGESSGMEPRQSRHQSRGHRSKSKNRRHQGSVNVDGAAQSEESNEGTESSASEDDGKSKLGKRKRSSKKAASKDVKKRAKKERNDNRAARWQYDTETREVIDAASDELNASILTSNPMANDEDIAIAAGHAWENACEATGHNVKLDGDLVAVLKGMLGSLMSRIKTSVRGQIMAEYQFGNSAEENANNKTLARSLLKMSNFAFKKHAPKHDPPSGLYRNVIILNSIKECYFKGPKDIGVKFPALFGPIPLELIAHIVTIIHFCIAQFNSETGARKNNHFVLNENRGRYKQYLCSLQDWRSKPGNLQVVADLQVSLYNAAREFAQAEEVATAGDVDLPTAFYNEAFSDN